MNCRKLGMLAVWRAEVRLAILTTLLVVALEVTIRGIILYHYAARAIRCAIGKASAGLRAFMRELWQL